MKLRWFVICNECGVKSEPTLQYWNNEYGCWSDVEYIECKSWEEAEYMRKKPEC